MSTKKPKKETHNTPVPHNPKQTQIWIDGGSRQNPGISGVGIVIENSVLHLELGMFISENASNNQAEYTALLVALTIAKSLSLEDIQIFSDSELVVKQVNLVYQCASEQLMPLYCAVQAEIGHFKDFKISHIPREENQAADRLANKGMDKFKIKKK